MVANITPFLILHKRNFKRKRYHWLFLPLRMRLIIDSGNTRIKFVVIDHGKIIEQGIVEDFSTLEKPLLIQFPALKQMIYADVRCEYSIHDMQQFFPNLQVHALKALKFPFASKYSTPNTLGDDRLALIAAAIKKYPNQDCLVIDAGTCITFDLVTAQKEYLGGAISPGIQMRFRALNEFTGKLPLISPPQQLSSLGESTQQSIETGVVKGVLHEIEGVIHEYQKKFPALTIILTGGDALYLSKMVKNTIFAEPNFLTEGLEYVLEYNKY